jgi:hypothetical protein
MTYVLCHYLQFVCEMYVCSLACGIERISRGKHSLGAACERSCRQRAQGQKQNSVSRKEALYDTAVVLLLLNILAAWIFTFSELNVYHHNQFEAASKATNTRSMHALNLVHCDMCE